MGIASPLTKINRLGITMHNLDKLVKLSKLAILTSILLSPIPSWANTQPLPSQTQHTQSSTKPVSVFSPDKEYQSGNIVSYLNWEYQANSEILAGTFIPGMGTPWLKYKALLPWDQSKVYEGGDRVLVNGIAYEAYYWTQGNDPTKKENQNVDGQTGRQWNVIGPWHNLTPDEINKLPIYNAGYKYSKGDNMKFKAQDQDSYVIYTAKKDVHAVDPAQKNPWKNYVDWKAIKDHIVSAKSSWPQHVFAPYTDMLLYNNVPDFSQLVKQKHIKHFTMAFVVSKSPTECISTWGAVVSMNGFDYDNLNQLRRKGGDAMLSIGGQANTPLATACTDVNTLATQYEDLVDNLDLRALDFDIEGAAVAQPDSIERRSQALAIAQKHWKDENRNLSLWITLPVLSSGLTADGKSLVQSLIDHGVQFSGINLMTMDYGSYACPASNGNPKTQAKCGIDAVSNTFNYLKGVMPDKTDKEIYSMLGTTPMIGVNDTAGEVLYLKGAKMIANKAKKQGLGMIGMWSIGRDKPRPASQASGSANANDSGLLPDEAGDYAFSKVFNRAVSKMNQDPTNQGTILNKKASN